MGHPARPLPLRAPLPGQREMFVNNAEWNVGGRERSLAGAGKLKGRMESGKAMGAGRRRPPESGFISRWCHSEPRSALFTGGGY